MVALWRRSLVALLLGAIAACSSPTLRERVEARERELMTPLHTRYADVVMGFDFHGPSVDVSIDANALESTDDSVVDAMKSEALRRWRATWLDANPGHHALLTVRLIDFRGKVWTTEHVRS